MEVDEDGRFTQRVDVEVGGNTLVLAAVDSAGNARSKVQSLLWSTWYRKPTVPKAGIAFDALGIWLSQEVLDDGEPAPPTDFAQIMSLVIQGLDLDSLIDPNTPVASQAGYQIYVTSIEVGSSDVALDAIDGGIALRITLNDIRGDLRFDCTTFGCRLLGGDSSGSYTVSSVVVDTDVLFDVAPDYTLSVTLQNTTTTINGLDVRSNNGFTNFLLGVVERFIIDSLIASLEAVLTDTISNELQPLLQEGLSALAFELGVDFPRLFGDGSIPIHIVTDFQSVDFRDSGPKGGAFVERGGAYADGVSPDDGDHDLGVPLRNRCGQGRAMVPLPKRAAIELSLGDDLLNQVLYAAWRGGWLEVDAGSELFGETDLSNVGVTDLQLKVSGLLAPTISDCNSDGSLRAHLGDLQVEGGLLFEGDPLTFTAYVTLITGVEVGIAGDGIGVGFGSIESIEIEINIHQDALIPLETLLRSLLETALRQTLEDALAAGGLISIPLPEIDLSGAVGLPPGSAVIDITPEAVERVDGFTVISADLYEGRRARRK